MFGIPLDFGNIQTAFASFFQDSDGVTSMLGLIFALGIVGLVLSALRSGLWSRK